MNSPPSAPSAPSDVLTFASYRELFTEQSSLAIWLELKEGKGRWHGFAGEGQHLGCGPEGLG